MINFCFFNQISFKILVVGWYDKNNISICCIRQYWPLLLHSFWFSWRNSFFVFLYDTSGVIFCNVISDLSAYWIFFPHCLFVLFYSLYIYIYIVLLSDNSSLFFIDSLSNELFVPYQKIFQVLMGWIYFLGFVYILA